MLKFGRYIMTMGLKSLPSLTDFANNAKCQQAGGTRRLARSPRELEMENILKIIYYNNCIPIYFR